MSHDILEIKKMGGTMFIIFSIFFLGFDNEGSQ